MAKATCERCGVAAGFQGARDRYGEWHAEIDIHGMNSAVGEDCFGDFPDTRPVRLKRDRSGLVLCRYCREQERGFDRYGHKQETDRERAERKRKELIARGQLSLLAEEER